jgi:hypothetical protein
MNDIDIFWTTETERVVISHDDDAESPRDDGDCHVGVMAAKGHRRYNLGDSGPLVDEVDRAITTIGPRLTARWLRIFHGATVVLPLSLYDHSGISMYVGGGAHAFDPQGWDSGLVGLIFDTPETREKTGVPLDRIEQALRDEVETYDSYLRGEIYVATLQRRETWTSTSGDTRTTWEDVDTIGGFFDTESVGYYFPEPAKV